MNTYKIALVDDEALFRQALSMLIDNNEQLETTISVDHGSELLQALENAGDKLPDLILCDMEMPVMDGVETTRQIAELYPDLKVVILSSHYEGSLILKMMEIGASAFMPKNEKPEAFYETIINVIEKGFHYNEYILKLIREKLHFGVKKERISSAGLTDREKEVLTLICEQKTNKEIGELIHISPRTVEGHRKKLLEKTGSKNTAGLIIFAVENGYFSVKISNKWSG